MRHVIGLSGGKDSTALALRLFEKEPRDYDLVCTPTGDELPEMEAHWEKLEGIFGKKIIRVDPGYTLATLVRKMKMLPNFRARFCTRMLKIAPYEAWMKDQLPATSYIGLRADEEGRSGYKPIYNSSEFTIRYPLREWGWGVGDVLTYLKRREITIPERTDCARCPFQRLSEWRALFLNYPDIYEDACADEDLTGHTYRSPSRDNWPAGLRDLAKEFESGRVPQERKRNEHCRACSL